MWFRRSPAKILAQSNPRLVLNELYQRIGADRGFAELSPPERYLVLSMRLTAEVLNGTIHQFLTNSSGDLYQETLAALNAVGAFDTVTILGEVAPWFPEGGPPPDRRTRNEQLLRWEAVTADSETQIRSLTNRLSDTFPGMRSRLVEFLRLHVDEIR